MTDLKIIGKEAKKKAQMNAVRETYERLKNDASWQEKKRTGKLWLIAAELNTTHTNVARYLAMSGITL